MIINEGTTTHFIDLPGGRIAYDVAGPADGHLVVCAPGMGDIRQEYRFLTPPLTAAGYRVVTFDLRGHGESGLGWDSYEPHDVGADYLALVDHLGGGPAVLVGTSYSPSMAVWAAAQAPDKVAGLVLISMFAGRPVMSPVQRLLSGLVMSRPALWRMFYRSLYARRPADFDEYCRRLTETLRRPGRMRPVSAMGLADKTTANGRAGEVRCPTLLVYGGKDPDFPDPAAEARAAARALAGTTTRTVLVDGAKHYPHVERPEEVAEPVLTLLGEAFGA